MKTLALLLALFSSPPIQAAIISSVQRLDMGGAAPPNSLFHSSPPFPTFSPFYPVWSDSSFQFRSVPSYLLGADQVRTRYFADSADDDFQLSITLDVPATVFLIIDNRVPDVATAMPWLSALGFADTGDDAVIQVSADSVLTTASIYGGSFPAGALVLLQQNDAPGNSGMFTVAAVPEPISVAFMLFGAAFCFRRRSLRTSGRNA